MKVKIGYGRDCLELEVAGSNLVPVRRAPYAPPIADVSAATREALEKPIGYPALRRALTPDDQIAVVVDEQIPGVASLITAILEHICLANVSPRAVTLICPPSSASQTWVDDLPDEFQEVRIEVHDPTERKRLAYLATTRHGRRVYLNRTAVDADQLVLLGKRGYDSFVGYSGAETSLYPALSDEATRAEAYSRVHLEAPGANPWPWRREAAEVAWLLGAPFLVQVIEGSDNELLHIVGGPVESAIEGQKLLDARWRVEVDGPVDIVVAGISGDPSQHGFADFSRALACAARVVKANGRIVVLTSAEPALGASADQMQIADEAETALANIRRLKPPDLEAGYQWTNAAIQAHIYLLSKLPSDVAEALFTTPLDDARQIERLLSGGGRCLFLEDAHKTMAVLKR